MWCKSYTASNTINSAILNCNQLHRTVDRQICLTTNINLDAYYQNKQKNNLSSIVKTCARMWRLQTCTLWSRQVLQKAKSIIAHPDHVLRNWCLDAFLEVLSYYLYFQYENEVLNQFFYFFCHLTFKYQWQCLMYSVGYTVHFYVLVLGFKCILSIYCYCCTLSLLHFMSRPFSCPVHWQIEVCCFVECVSNVLSSRDPCLQTELPLGDK